MNFYIGNYWYILLLLLIIPIGYWLWHYLKWKNQARTTFADSRFQSVLFQKPTGFTKVFPFLYLIGFLFLIFSMIDLLGGKEEIKVQQKMSNVIFLMDVSNSMNTQDVNPDRLTLAKNIVINTLQQRMNDRVGLVVFAGDATSVMPLTTDYSAAESFISGIETSMVSHQGTDFKKGVEVAASKFKNITKGTGKIVLISDGEDNEGNENDAIKIANKEGIQIITVGIGTEEGAPIPEYFYGQLMGYKTDLMGETVISKRATQALNTIAKETGGTYIDGNDPDQAIEDILKALKQSTNISETTVKSQTAIHYYQYFLAVTLVLFFIIFLTNPKRDFNI